MQEREKRIKNHENVPPYELEKIGGKSYGIRFFPYGYTDSSRRLLGLVEKKYAKQKVSKE
jgi:hypothetical protein